VWDWDVVFFHGEFRLLCTAPADENIDGHRKGPCPRITSEVVGVDGHQLDEPWSTLARPGARLHTVSGKTYILQGPRRERHDLAGNSVIDPDSWYNRDRVPREEKLPWWRRILR
jgi:hypothetical protein